MRCICGKDIINPRDEVCMECMAAIADSLSEMEMADSLVEEIYESYVNPDMELSDMMKPGHTVDLPRTHGTSGSSATSAPVVTTSTTNTKVETKKEKDEETIEWVHEEQTDKV